MLARPATQSPTKRHHPHQRDLLNEYRSLAARVDRCLSGSRRRWATEIDPARQRQRQIIGELYAPGGCASPQWTRLRRYCVNYTDNIANEYANGAAHKIYVRINPDAPKLRYVGRHEGPAAGRDHDHLIKGSTEAGPATLYSQRIARATGSAGMFIDVPLYVCPPGTQRVDAHRIEQTFCKSLGTLQGPQRKSAASRKPRHRPVMQLRGLRKKKCDIEQSCDSTRVTLYDKSTCFASVLRQASRTGDELCVRVQPHAQDLSNFTLARLRYGASVLQIVFKDDLTIVTTVKSWAALITRRKWGECFEPIRQITILRVVEQGIGVEYASAYETAVQLGRHPHSSRSVAETTTYAGLRRIMTAAGYVRDKRVKARALEQLIAISRRKFGVSLKSAPTISVPASIEFPTHLVCAAGKRLIGRLDGIDASARQYLETRLRPVRARAETVGGTLMNHKHVCNEYDPDVPPECTCRHYPREWRKLRQFDGHFAILSSEYTGPGSRALHCSHKSPYEVTADDLYGELTKSLRRLRSTLPATVQHQVGDEMISEVVRGITRDHQRWLHRRRPEAAPRGGQIYKKDVMRAKKHLRHATVSPVDKGGGLMLICCPCVMWSTMKQAWPDELHRCTVICPATADAETSEQMENNILTDYSKQYYAAGWSSVGKIYGETRDGDTANRRSCIPAAYAIPKGKAIRAAEPGLKARNTIKGRPIAPHTRHPLKNVYNRNATGYHLVLTSINVRRVTRMFSTDEYPLRLKRELAELQEMHTARGGGQLKVLRQFGDLAGMYTDLRMDRMNDALRNCVQYLRESTDPERRYPMRAVDRVSVPRHKAGERALRTLGPAYNHEEQVEIPFETMFAINDYSNAKSIIRVGRQIRKYTLGTPMGEQQSCAKANGVCLDDELKIDRARELAAGDSCRNISLAFVDDKHARVVYDENDYLWTKASAEEYLGQLMTYSEPLQMVIEPPSRATEFLETLTVYSPNSASVETYHKYRPWKKRSYRIAMGQVIGAAKMQLNTAIGTFIRIICNSTDDLFAANSIVNEADEMMNGAGVKLSTIREALSRLRTPRTNQDRQRRLTRFCDKFEVMIMGMCRGVRRTQTRDRT